MNQNRRAFLNRTFGASCGYAATLSFAPLIARRAYARDSSQPELAKRPFARIEQLAPDVYALVSTPFTVDGKAGDLSTHSNGGLIVGRDRILAIDSYRTPEGARFMAETCLELTGRLPTHVVTTHFHFDHLGGTAGFIAKGVVPETIMTQTTRELAYSAYGKSGEKDESGPFSTPTLTKWGGRFLDASRVIDDESKSMPLDLGGRTVTITPMRGHTGSDLVIVDDETGITFGGDLIWDGIFPNFMSSLPSQWRTNIAKLTEGESRLMVPGHGSVQQSDSKSFELFSNLHNEIERYAREQHAKGNSADNAAKTFSLPQSLGDWQYFRAGFHEIAMDAWYRELNNH